MQVLITHGSLARTRVLSFSRWQLVAFALLLVALLMMASGAIYHFIFLKAAREGWPVVSQVVRLVVRDEIAQRDRFMRENLDAIAQKVGEVQAKLVKLEAMGERVVGLAGVKADELKPLKRTTAGGTGGPYVPVGSGFGIRTDPWTGHAALHAGLDFPAPPGTPVHAAAGGIVVTKEWHPAYGNLLELDHGNGLVTRYAHNSSVDVPLGALVKRGQRVAQVGNTGRSTGPHLHFEVLVEGAPQDPARFLAGKAPTPAPLREFAQRPMPPPSAAGPTR